MLNIEEIVLIRGIKRSEQGYPEFDYEVKEFIGDTPKDIYANITKKVDYIPKKGDKLYIFSGCSIPRFKLKEFHEKHGTRLVKYDNTSNVAFTSFQAVNQHFESEYLSLYPKDYVTNYLIKVLGTEDPRYTPLLSTLDSNNNAFVELTWDVCRDLKEQTYFMPRLFNGSNAEQNDKRTYTSKRKFKKPESKTLIEKMLKHPKVFDQKCLQKHLNSGTIIDDDMYTRLKDLFNSKDSQNTKLAMELLANCDYEESALPILLLIKDYGGKMYESGNRNHVNFKALTEFFNIRDLSYIKLDNVVNMLKEKGLLTPENVNRMIPIVTNELNNERRTKAFSIQKVVLAEEHREDMNNAEFDKTEEVIDDNVMEELNPRL